MRPTVADRRSRVDAAYVDEHLGKLAEDEDFRRYIL